MLLVVCCGVFFFFNAMLELAGNNCVQHRAALALPQVAARWSP